MTSGRRIERLRSASAAALGIVAFPLAALALPPAPAPAPAALPWAIKFPGLASEVNARAKSSMPLEAVCWPAKVKARVTAKRLDFERAFQDKTLKDFLNKQAQKPPLGEVVVRLRAPADAKGCTVRLKNVMFAQYTIEAPTGKYALERFSLVYSEASAVP